MTNAFDGDCAPTRPISIFSANGTDDGTVPYTGSTDYNSQVDVVNYWKTHNNITTDAEVTDVNSTIQRTLYSDGDNGTAVDHYRLEGGTHIWHGDDLGGSDLSTLVWKSVSSHSLSGTVE
jgi:polyhydroxybutyrate depolymerase